MHLIINELALMIVLEKGTEESDDIGVLRGLSKTE
jgi:hypothetical protein